jgi:hypothetical protein
MNITLLLLVLPVAGAVLMGIVKVVRAAGTVLWWIGQGAKRIAEALLRGDWRVVAAVLFAGSFGAMLWTNAIGAEPDEVLSTVRPMLNESVAGPITVAHVIAGGIGGGIAHAIHLGTRTIVWTIADYSWRK